MSSRRASVPVILTSSCRDARSVRPLCQKLQHRDLTTTDAQIVRPYRILSRLVSSHSASLVLVIPTSSCRDARSVRPLCQRLQRHVLTGTDALRLDTLVRPYRIQSRLVSSRRDGHSRAFLQGAVTLAKGQQLTANGQQLTANSQKKSPQTGIVPI